MPLLKETEFKKHISSEHFSNIYLIYGDEKMLVKSLTQNLIKKITSDQISEFNFHEFDNDSEITDISVAINVAPFTSPVNLVKITDMDFDSLKTSDFDAMVKMLSDIPESTILIFTMPTLDCAKSKFTKIKSIVEKSGVCVELEHRSELSLEKTLCKWANQAGSKMTDITASRLIKYVGTDLNVLHTEVEKLSAYAYDTEITVEMIDKLVNKNVEGRVFDLFDFCISQNGDKAISTLNTLFYQREEPITICIILGNAYVDAYRVRVATESGVSTKDLAEELNYKNKAWLLDKIKKQIKNVTTNSLRLSIDEIISTQEKFVSVTINSRIELEKLISKLVILAGDTKNE